MNINIRYCYITADSDGYCIRAFSELKIRTARFSACKTTLKIASFTITKYIICSVDGNIII